MPTSLVDDHPDIRKAVEIAGTVRDLALAAAREGIAAGGDGLDGAGRLLAAHAPDLLDRLPWPDVEPPGQAGAPADLPHAPGSFTTAKRLLYDEIYRGHRVSFYCGCPFDGDLDTQLGGCGLSAYRGQTRADRIEAEHLFPASQFGNYRECWREPGAFDACRRADGTAIPGRDCCQRVDPVFVAAHNDLHNLVPAVGLINGQRSDYNWGMVPGGATYGTCQIRIDSGIRRVEPPAAVRGDIARTMLYMRDAYGFRLSRQDEQLYRAWSNGDPPDEWERARNRRIEAVQGNANPYVTDYHRL
ncbi:MAG: deoxyribonuclease I [Sphingobacteriia bacterium]|nr:deoxyribonuclease I [Sphingobacteriia bacterium]